MFYKYCQDHIPRQLQSKKFHFIYIDGDHRYEGVKIDIEAWYPKVRKGGLICGHDYTGEIIPAKYDVMSFNVKKAVDEFFAGKQLFISREKEFMSWMVLK